MKFSAVIFFALTSSISASPAASPDVLSTRTIPCTPGTVYCGWVLIDQSGWNPNYLRQSLCDAYGHCDFTNGDAWNSLWMCTGDWTVEAKAIWGGDDSCAGPSAHCVYNVPIVPPNRL